ncbi:tail protein X [Salinicola aestuarinus]|uniref:tail protein X n=1 Tax=Salinicola aestuarinus TaxID=1949082 RepID=UPI000DA1C624|nr:tail protein X [Salinicola aestuarinus]
MSRNVRSQQGDTLDRLCHRHYGTTAVTEPVLLANPGLCELGPILPSGTAVVMPEIATPTPAARTVRLWD